MRFGTSGYIMETAAAAAAIPSAMPVAKPNTFISVTFSFRKSLLSRVVRSVSVTLSGGISLPREATDDTLFRASYFSGFADFLPCRRAKNASLLHAVPKTVLTRTLF